MRQALAIGGAWVAFMIVLPVNGPDIRQFSDLIVGALIGAGLIIVGFAAASRVRPMPTRQWREQFGLARASLLLGAKLGFGEGR